MWDYSDEIYVLVTNDCDDEDTDDYSTVIFNFFFI